MPAVNLSPVLKQRFFDTNGNPLAGGKVYSYQAGTTTPQATYTDATGTSANTNPVILDASGEADIWLDQALSYKIVLDNSADVQQWETDGIVGILTPNAVNTAAIADGAVTTPKLADGAVTSAKIATNAIAQVNMQDDSVGTAELIDENVTLAKLAVSLQQAFVPSGAILAFGGETGAVPAGFLFCDGSAVSRTTYAALFAAIGVAWGNGDGTTTFRVPDLRGRFVRGTDEGTGRDPDSASRTAINTGGNTGDVVGSLQGDAIRAHDHAISIFAAGGPNDSISRTGDSNVPLGTADTLTNTGNETRPINAYVNYIIKT